MRDDEICRLVKLVSDSKTIGSLTVRSWPFKIEIVKFFPKKKFVLPASVVESEQRKSFLDNYFEIRSNKIGLFLWEDMTENKTLFGKDAEVYKGQTLGHINSHGELYSPIVSPYNGFVRKILESGTPVGYGESLIYLEKKNEV